jgi:hypothetical protein
MRRNIREDSILQRPKWLQGYSDSPITPSQHDSFQRENYKYVCRGRWYPLLIHSSSNSKELHCSYDLIHKCLSLKNLYTRDPLQNPIWNVIYRRMFGYYVEHITIIEMVKLCSGDVMRLLWSTKRGFISQKATFFIVTAVKTSNLT